MTMTTQVSITPMNAYAGDKLDNVIYKARR